MGKSNRFFLYGLILLDLLGIFAFISIIRCFGVSTPSCEESINSGPSKLIILLAIVGTAFYLYKRYKANLPLLPVKIDLLAKPNFPWSFALYYFFALIFFGENLPELTGYIRGMPLGTPGTHASLMNPALFFTGNGSTFLDLSVFAGIAILFGIFFRFLNVLVAYVLSVISGMLLETKMNFGKAAGPEGFDLTNKLWRTELDFFRIWSLIIILPFIIFWAVNKYWGGRGITIAILVLIFLNIACYFFFKYQIEVLKHVQPGFLPQY